MYKQNDTSIRIANEDMVVCHLYSTSDISTITVWEDLCTKINDVIEKLATGYIWHRDEFNFSIPIQDYEFDGTPTHLVSSTYFGDNIEDEWFIVYIVFEITKLFDDVIIQIHDSDGEFLLIEAADCLPTWANPESTENRVYIYKNHVHLIPKSVNVSPELTVEEAIDIIKSKYQKTQATSDIQNAIRGRITGYPEKIADSTHRGIVMLPVDIAALLSFKPSLIAPLVTTYCNHDSIDIKSCKDVNFQNCIDVDVKFTKCLYAMLMHSKMIRSSKNKINENDKKSCLGFKLTSAYYMIMNNSKDVFSSKEFHKFLNCLKVNGYFKDNLEGSKDYKILFENAKDYFLRTECPINSYVANVIANLTSSHDFSVLKEKMMRNTDTDLIGDNDDWLNIHPDHLNDLLNTRYGKTEKFKGKDVITPHSISSKLSEFLKQTSDFEGIEQSEVKAERVQFDPDDFVNSLEKMLSLLSSGGNVGEASTSDSEGDYDLSDDEISEEIKRELENEVINFEDGKHDSILNNIVKSMKEEQASTGPSSNVLKSIGINKTDVLDSDDD
ncbi:protein ecdysoneless [Plodia interpunctella]|uniref:protein ecdysoneless n=1 Tax=Plodia interpunctella TaxID=58824 RepID=UPI0023687CCE|nr:protein ecdysoneless [Plodia interpunctella]XP_053606321.1 protein ecdysoneless [Plodia interpunctella]XP_053606322.1 protein ecdysoneless [Plodia interpunctella]XP_053606324.1 protein ecdysoneless [Plodia interpunctella]